jgi:uncharacterized membrane protein (UPF0136 family)
MSLVNQSRPRGITVVSILMILFGLAEVMTSFTHNFFGISTARGVFSICAGVMVGALYIVAGLLILSARRWAVIPAMICLGADILGRVAMVLTGLFPVNSFFQMFAIVTGTAIAAAFALCIWSKRNSFQ